METFPKLSRKMAFPIEKPTFVSLILIMETFPFICIISQVYVFVNTFLTIF